MQPPILYFLRNAVLLGKMLLLSLPLYSAVIGQDKLAVEAPEGMKVQEPKDPILMYLKRQLNVRRGLIKRTCELSEDNIKNLASIDEDWIKLELANGVPRQDGALNQGRLLVLGANDSNKIRQVQSLLEKKLTDCLSQEQRGQVRTAIEDSEKFECEANAQLLVSLMDKWCVLTADQQESLEPKIASWLKGKSLYMQFYPQSHYLPDIPESIFENVLTPEQRKRFKAIPKTTVDRMSLEIQMIQQNQPFAEQDY